MRDIKSVFSLKSLWMVDAEAKLCGQRYSFPTRSGILDRRRRTGYPGEQTRSNPSSLIRFILESDKEGKTQRY